MDQQWKDIEGYEGRYQIGDLGDIRSIQSRSHFIYPWLHRGLYPRVNLYKNGKRTKFFVHILVAQAFVPNPLNLPEVNHVKGIKTDNRATELEWTTRQKNMLHSYQVLGNKSKGKSYPRSKLPKGYFNSMT